jgi:aldehyde:ferredoxin oxidoreductase
MELDERGLLDTGLSFGDARKIAPLLSDIAYRRGLGAELAEGVRRLSEKYGGSEFAIHVKGLEMAAYDPRGCNGQGLGYATANSGATHLSGSTHAIEVESYLSPYGTRGKAHFVRFMQDVTDAVNSSIFCIQTEYPFLEENPAYKYTPMPILRFMMRNLPGIAVATTDLSDYAALMSGLLGERIGQKEFYRAGERTFNLDRFMNTREGIDRRSDTLPGRILSEARVPGEPRVELDKMLAQYYRLRGWDEDGRPTPGLLKRLDIEIPEEVSHDGR